MTKRIGLYTGSFDPITLGHLGVVEKACYLVDELIIGIGINQGKDPLFTFNERLYLATRVFQESKTPFACPVRVITFNGLTYLEAQRLGATVIIRGMRDTTDFNEENAYAGMMENKAADIPVIWIPSKVGTSHIASRLVKQAAKLDDVNEWVPPMVAAELKSRR